MKQRNLAMFGLVDILVEYTLTMIGFQGLITELKVWKLHRQTLKVNRGQKTFQGHSNKPKYDYGFNPPYIRVEAPFPNKKSADIPRREIAPGFRGACTPVARYQRSSVSHAGPARYRRRLVK
ncbi:hypothetical protein EVAR_48599_1 [Eumeta japonica]|uniref:Uncharacterized protein n=1 Tax=Eumeta variegata TaxID=151549 RepID=A0A4C1YZ66_EUMVA|nr:hypothetical protein EVAR_48599_1 [Eumeta japonica]